MQKRAVIASRGAAVSWASVEGLPFPLGATWVPQEEAWNFAVYSEHAEQVTLLLYTEAEPSTVGPAGRSLRGVLGHGQQPELRAPLRAADDPGQPALLGPGDARRRVPLRPRLGLRAPAGRLPRLRGPADLRGHRVRPRPCRPAPDRRAVGRRRRLPARPRLSWDHVGAVERALPRRPAPVRTRRCRHGAGADAAALRQRRPLPGRRKCYRRRRAPPWDRGRWWS